MQKKDFLSAGLSFLLLTIVVVICYLERATLIATFRDVSRPWLLIGFASYICNYLLRTCRLKSLTNFQTIAFRSLFKICCLHGFFSYFLPMRSGDLSLPLLLKKDSDISLTIGSAVLIKSRLLDMVSLGFFLLLSTIFSYDQVTAYHLLLFGICSFCLVAIPYALVFLLRFDKIATLRFFQKLPPNFQLKHYTLMELTLSFLIWFFVGCTLFSVVVALSIPLSFLDIWFLTAIQLPLQLVPIQGVANAGNHEIGWVAGFSVLGISPDLGLSFALASHVAIILYVALLGIVGLLIPITSERQPYS